MANIQYIKIDETQFWRPEFVAGLGPGAKLVATYLFDADEKTFCCEIRPSYFLRHVGTDWEGGRELTSEESEKYYDAILEAEAHCDADHYRHCGTLANAKPVPFECEDLEEAIEAFAGNPW